MIINMQTIREELHTFETSAKAEILRFLNHLELNVAPVPDTEETETEADWPQDESHD